MTVGRFRRNVWIIFAAAASLLLLAVLAEQLPEPTYAAYAGGAVEVCLVALGGALLAQVFVGSYVEDRASITRWPGWRYLRRCGTWSLAGAGVGAVLATALPPSITVAQANPHAIPVAGWLAIVLGAVGFALGLVEEWHGGSGERD